VSDINVIHWWWMKEQDRRDLGLHAGPELEMLEGSGLNRVDPKAVSRYWVCGVDEERWTEAGIVNAYGVVGCHKHRPELYDPDEYDHEHDSCGWVIVIRTGR